MDRKTSQALLAHATAQTELLAVIARYYSGLIDRDVVEALPGRVLVELQDVSPDAAALAERLAVREDVER